MDLAGPLSLVTAPSGQIVTTAEAKAQAWVEVDEDGTFIDSLIAAATDHCELDIYGHRQIRQATWDLPVRAWWDVLPLPRPPLASVTSVKYYDTAGVEQTLASSNYLVRTPHRQPGTIDRAPNVTWPSVQSDRRFPITVRFVAGYASASVVPTGIKQAILMVAAHWYANREAVLTGAISKEIELGVERLLNAQGWGSYA